MINNNCWIGGNSYSFRCLNGKQGEEDGKKNEIIEKFNKTCNRKLFTLKLVYF
jgi:hypothetical protein